jgi:hypothetical protein
MTPVQALQKALEGEHAAVFLYGVLGSRTSGSRQPTLAAELTQAFADHRDQRDALTVMISATGQDPVASLVEYRVPGPVGTPAQVTAVARTLEERLTRTYGELVAHTSGRDRAWAVAALDRSALRGLSFGSRPSDFPGLS